MHRLNPPLERFRVLPGQPLDLHDIPTRFDAGIPKHEGKALMHKLQKRLVELQSLLYAEGKRSLLVVMQAMDAGGKDSTLRRVFGPVDPAGCHITSFKAPTAEELAQDFLWRVHQHTPRAGYIGVFNRSHYEDVVIVSIKNLVPKAKWQHRWDHINAFEKMLTDEGTVIRKFFLHISKDYQKKRLQRRLDRPDKHWKFNVADLDERARWDDYMRVYADTMTRTSFDHAPWLVVPAERRWLRDLLILKSLVDTLEAMAPQTPKPTFDPNTITIPD
ncbi:MAG: PPK2 family polyphosphate kinase [Planctomycetota bacterium]